MSKDDLIDAKRETYNKHIRDAFPEIESIEDDKLQEKTVAAWTLALERGGWRDIQDIPHTWNISDLNTVDHLRGVYKVAMASADIQEEFYGIAVDRDAVRTIALTHDMGKALEYTTHVDEDLLDNPDPEYVGDDIPHQLSGYALAFEVGLPRMIRRAIPHGPYELPERAIESELIKSANSVSTNAMTMKTMGLTIDEWHDQYHD